VVAACKGVDSWTFSVQESLAEPLLTVVQEAAADLFPGDSNH